MTPLLAKHINNIESRNFLDDPQQEKILHHLEDLYKNLMDIQAQNTIKNLINNLFGAKSNAISSIYIWGEVGRGKTYLLDIFFNSLNEIHQKRRYHFTDFMLQIHASLESLHNEPNPLTKIANDISNDVQILCLDELTITDIADAAILSGLLENLAKKKITLVITSNTRPKDLYLGGVNRDKIFPAIKFLETRTNVLHLHGQTDYRLQSKKSGQIYHSPHNSRIDDYFRTVFYDLTNGVFFDTKIVNLSGRTVIACLVSENIAWFNFENLCNQPLSKLEYSFISKKYHTLILSNVPILGPNQDDAARRFIELIDNLYEQRVRLIISAMAQPESLYIGTRLTEQFKRTISRLGELSSKKYISQIDQS